MKKSLIVLIGLILLVSCSSKKTPKQLATQHLENAKVLMADGKFMAAKLQIDSISLLYPNQTNEINQGVLLLNEVELKEQRQSKLFLDSAIQVRNAQLEKLGKDFILKPGGVQYKSGRYEHKRQQVKNSYDRTFVKAYLDEKGTFFISSKYAGKSFIYHNQIKVYNEGLYAETQVVPEDGIENRRYTDDGMCWETVHYRHETDNQVAEFIVNNFDKRLKVMYKGKKPYYIVMEQYDKEAIRDAYLMSKLMKETQELDQQLKDTQKRIEELVDESIEIRKALSE